MILYALAPYESLAIALRALVPLAPGACMLARFPNGELHGRVDPRPHGHGALVVGAVAPPDEQLLSTLLVAHTLGKEGATEVVAALPYLGYARQDRAEPGESLATAWLGELLAAVGVVHVTSIDVHSSLARALFPIPLHSLSPAAIFADQIRALGWTDPTVVAPDEGALERSDAVRCAASITRPVAYFVKRRTPEGVAHLAFQGEVGKKAIVVDDILDTGKTLVAACEALVRSGVDEIAVMVTHGLFTGCEWKRLWRLPVRRLYCTDSVPPPGNLGDMPVTVLSIAPVLADWVRGRLVRLAA